MSENRLPHILVVEDEAIVAMQIKRTLQKLGYTTCSAASGEDAIRLAKTEKPDLALMDIMLAGEMDGIRAAAFLSRHHGTPIVYLTANADESTINRAKLTEPYGYILKPFQEARLRSTIDVALHRHAIANRLKEGSATFLPAFEGTEDAVFTSDVNGLLAYMNLAWETLTNSKLDQARGTELPKLFRELTEGQQAILGEAIAQAIKTGSEVPLASHGIQVSAAGAPALGAHAVVPIGPSKESVTGVVLIFRGTTAPGERTSVASVPASPEAQQRIVSDRPQEGRRISDGLSGLPSRAEAEKALETVFNQATHRFAVALVLDRFDLIRHRFGMKAAEEVLLFYSIHLAQSMGPTDLLFQWSGPAFLMLLDRPAATNEVRREISSWAGVRLEKMIEAASHSAMLVVSGKWRLFEALETARPQALIEEIDGFAGVAKRAY